MWAEVTSRWDDGRARLKPRLVACKWWALVAVSAVAVKVGFDWMSD